MIRKLIPWTLATLLLGAWLCSVARAQSLPAGMRAPSTVRLPAGAANVGGTYAHFRTLTTDYTQAGSSDSSSFPVVVILNSSNAGTTMKTVANGGHIQHTVTQVGGNGGMEPADLVFSATSTCSTLLPWETETYDATGGTLIAWVNIGTLSHTANNTFYLCYDGSGVTTQQNTGSYAPSYVWNSHFMGVWHLPNGATLAVNDSTSNTTTFTTVSAVTATAGQVDGGGAFNGSAYLGYSVSSGGSLDLTDPLTIEAWVYPTTSGFNQVIVSNFNNSGFGNYTLELGATTGAIIWEHSGYTSTLSVSPGWTVNAWNHIVIASSSGSQTVYINGVVVGTAAQGAASTGASILYVGGYVSSYLRNPLAGIIDEVRVSSASRSADWITAEYNNQKTSSTFLTVGPEI